MTDGVVVEANDADDLAVVLHGGGDFAGGGGADSDVAGVAGDVGHELGAGVKSDPASDTLTETKHDLAVIGRQANLGFDFEAAVVWIEERDRAGGALEVGEKFAQDTWEDECRIVALETERGDAAERGLIGEGKGGG